MKFYKVFTVTRESTKQEVNSVEEDDYVTKCMGSFGVWQAMFCGIAAMTRFTAMWNMLSMVFLTPPTEFGCVAFKKNVTFEIKPSTCYEDCAKYEFYDSVFESSLISRFNLICDDAWLAGFAQSILMFGVLVGIVFYGWISDSYGRRIALCLSMFVGTFSMFAAPFAPNYWIFIVIRFFVGTTGANLNISSVYMIEIVGSRHRDVVSCFAMTIIGIAEASLSIFAFFTSTWTEYLLALGVVSSFICLLSLALPETPRWLVTKGKTERAVDIIRRAAERNKLNTANIEDTISKTVAHMKTKENEGQRYNYIDLFRSKDNVVRMLCMFMIFFAAGGGYFGITQHVTFLGYNLYMDVALLGLIQVPVSFLPILLNKFFGRRGSTIFLLVATSACMATLIFIPQGHWAFTVVGVIGMSAISVSFAVAYIYVTELFPTAIRSMAFGIISLGTEIGAMSTPFVAVLRPHWISSLILAVIPFLATLACTFLPETKGQHLKDTVK